MTLCLRGAAASEPARPGDGLSDPWDGMTFLRGLLCACSRARSLARVPPPAVGPPAGDVRRVEGGRAARPDPRDWWLGLVQHGPPPRDPRARGPHRLPHQLGQVHPVGQLDHPPHCRWHHRGEGARRDLCVALCSAVEKRGAVVGSRASGLSHRALACSLSHVLAHVCRPSAASSFGPADDERLLAARSPSAHRHQLGRIDARLVCARRARLGDLAQKARQESSGVGSAE